MRGSLCTNPLTSRSGFRVVVILDVAGCVRAALGLAHLLQLADPPPQLLLLGVEVNRVLFDLVVDGVELVADDLADEGSGEEEGRDGQTDDAERVEVDVHVSIIPCVWGKVKRKDDDWSYGRSRGRLCPCGRGPRRPVP